jgi:hypothetical protein
MGQLYMQIRRVWGRWGRWGEAKNVDRPIIIIRKRKGRGEKEKGGERGFFDNRKERGEEGEKGCFIVF